MMGHMRKSPVVHILIASASANPELNDVFTTCAVHLRSMKMGNSSRFRATNVDGIPGITKKAASAINHVRSIPHVSL
jgi:hypothetical protein